MAASEEWSSTRSPSWCTSHRPRPARPDRLTDEAAARPAVGVEERADTSFTTADRGATGAVAPRSGACVRPALGRSTRYVLEEGDDRCDQQDQEEELADDDAAGDSERDEEDQKEEEQGSHPFVDASWVPGAAGRETRELPACRRTRSWPGPATGCSAHRRTQAQPIIIPAREVLKRLRCSGASALSPESDTTPEGIVARLDAAWRRRDWRAIQGLYHPDALSRSSISGGAFDTPDVVVAAVRKALGDSVVLDAQVHSIEPVDPDAALAVGRLRMANEDGGGGWGDNARCWLVTVKDGLVFRTSVYDTPEAALAEYRELGASLGVPSRPKAH